MFVYCCIGHHTLSGINSRDCHVRESTIDAFVSRPPWRPHSGCEGFELAPSTSRSKVNTWPMRGGVNCIIELITSHHRVQLHCRKLQAQNHTAAYTCECLPSQTLRRKLNENRLSLFLLLHMGSGYPWLRASISSNCPIQMAEPISGTRCVTHFLSDFSLCSCPSFEIES